MGKNFDITMTLKGKDEGAKDRIKDIVDQIKALRKQKKALEEGKDAETGKGSSLDRLQEKIKLLRKEERMSGEAALKSVLKGGAGEIAETLGDALGAGAAIMGIGFVAGALKKTAEEATELRHEFAQGKVTLGEMADRMAGQVPILGQVWQAGRAIRELFTGEKMALEAINAEAKLTGEYFDIQARNAGRVRDILQGMKEDQKRATREAAYAGKDEFTKRIGAMRDELADMEATRERRLEEKIREGTTGIGAEVAKQQAILDSLEARRKSALENMPTSSTAGDGSGIGMVWGGEDVAAIEAEIADAQAKIRRTRERAAADAMKIREQFDLTEAAQVASRRASISALEREDVQKIERERAENIQREIRLTREKDKELASSMQARRKDELEGIRGIEQAQSDLRQKTFAAGGKSLDAERERIRQYYAERIEVARTAAEREALEQSRALDLEAASRSEKRRQLGYLLEDMKSGGRVTTGLTSEFQGLASSRARQIERQERAISRAADNSDQQVKLLQRLVEYMTAQPKTGTIVLRG